ncbi:hypothetical protein [Pararhodobacter sp.]|nr:hypothetical protein [Pararhodobacter sp.]
MNTQVETAGHSLADADHPQVQLPAGAGLALAVVLGSVMWLGIFALVLI